MRSRVTRGWAPRDALVSAVAQNVRIVLIAGITVTAGVASLSVAKMPLFRVFGPGLALMVVVALVVSITLVPAMLAILGRVSLWPGAPAGGRLSGDDGGAGGRGRLIRLLTRRSVAVIAAAFALAALLAASWPLLGFRASVSSPDSLPAGDPVRVAAAAAARGFAPGVLAPTEILVQRPGIISDGGALADLQRRIEGQPGVAAVLGPQQQPLVSTNLRHVGVFLAPGGGAARYVVIFRHDALSAPGLEDLGNLQLVMPTLLARTGLGDAHVQYIGASALGADFLSTARADAVRVAIVVGLVNLVLLMVFLRAVVAPVYLLACSFLSVGAALGLTTWVFQTKLGHQGLIFYAPFAAAVLLISLGSDYNIFTVGRIWDEARSRPLREALAVAVPRSARPVRAAGLALAVSFAFVGLIPIAPFQELALAVAGGVLIDTFLVRSLLVPALIVLVGRLSGWPGHLLSTGLRPGGRSRPSRASPGTGQAEPQH